MRQDADPFDTLHAGLTVELIQTPRDDLVTCCPQEKAAEVLDRNLAGNGAQGETYDYLPVEDRGEIVGLFRTRRGDENPPMEGQAVETLMDPLSPRNLIGSDGTILDFLREVDERPYRLVVSGNGISGLVTWSDLQKLPVRTAVFGLITGFELEMIRAIRRAYPSGDAWSEHLGSDAKERVDRLIQRSRKNDSEVDSLLYTTFRDKAKILLNIDGPGVWVGSRSRNMAQLRTINDFLRNPVAHARDYVAAREDVERLQAMIQGLLSLRDQVATWSPEEAAEAQTHRGRPRKVVE
ncbi:MAG: CBS domain-containing protein [Gemmatimonadota bacterium]|nr:CBS domain-containing protein [Gemmatimonadota bacterium]